MQNAFNPSPDTLTPREALRLDYATPLGRMDLGVGTGPIMLWNLRKPLGPHPAGSTIAEATLDRLLANLHPIATESTPAGKLAEFSTLKASLE